MGGEKRRSGFTLVELMVVIVIIGILAGVVVMKYTGHDYTARVTRVKADFKTLDDAITLFKLNTGSYPEKLEDLIEQPPEANNWQGPYLKGGIPLDPWDTEYQYSPDEGTGGFVWY